MSAGADARRTLEDLLRAALCAVEAGERVRAALAAGALPASARLRVLAVGKAAPAMARALEAWAGERIVAGLCVTRDAHGAPPRRLALRLAGHPVPDARSTRAAGEVLRLVCGGEPGEVLVVLLSGGASALLGAPDAGLTLADVSATSELLLRSGAPIEELNAVRKHLCALFGGRLAARARASRIEVLVVSDVLGDRLDVIGSGPCSADPTRYADALRVLETRGLLERVPAPVRAHLEAGQRGERPETPKPGDPRLERVRVTVLARNADALHAAAEAAQTRGLLPLRGGRLCGEARLAGRRLAALAGSLRPRRPVCLLAGGETTVTVRGEGRGGRSQELALAAALELAGRPGIALLAAGTDGSDGPTDAAGAFVDGGSVARGAEHGADASACLARNDSHGFFALEGGLLRTGPTGTNVMDVAFALVAPPRA